MAVIEDEFRLIDLIDVEILQRIQDAFSLMTGIASLTTDTNGVPITKGSNFSEFCTKYVRASEVGRKRCEDCDRMGAELTKKKGISCAYLCHAGLVDFAAPIVAGGHQVGCFIGGQVLTEPVNVERKRRVAAAIGVDPEKLLDAAYKVQIIDKERIDKATTALSTIANVLSEIAYSKYEIYLKNLELEKSSRMKSDFLANMSHEIRTPMNAVIGMAEMTLREDLSPAARKYVSQIRSSGQTLLTIINDILDFSKIESGKMDITEIEYEPMSLINDLASIILTRIGNKNLELTIDMNPNLPRRLYGDNIRIKQIMVNLSNNAVKFTREGCVHLKVDFQKTGEDTMDLKVDVSDTGSGIKKQDMGKLFRSFQQVDSKRNRNIEGTGLGLAISKQLLSLMGGQIHVESTYGEGSTFSFVIPQKIINSKPCAKALSGEGNVGALIQNEFIAQEMEIDVKRLGLDYRRLTSEDELSQLKEGELQYLFVEHLIFSDTVQDFLRDHPDVSGVLLINYRATPSYDIPNLRMVRKPLYTLSMESVFRGEDVSDEYLEMDTDDFDFTAPKADILLVDDNTVNLLVAEGLLEPLNMRIDTALSGSEAIEKITDKRYDIVFMDHMMPEMDGVETTRVIRRLLGENGQIPIIALTANAVDGTKEMFISEGMNDFVTKPIDLKVMSSKLKRWLPPEKILKNSENSADEKTPQNGSSADGKDSQDESEKQAAPIFIEGLDVQAAMKLLGSEKLFWAVLKEYCRVIDKKSALIERYEREEKWRDYTVEVHALKSASRQIGAMELASAAERMEAAGNAEEAALIHESTPEMLKLYISYKDILAPYFEEGDSEQGKGSADSRELAEFFDQMREAMDNLDMEGMEEVIQNMSRYSYSGKQKDYFERLKDAVEDIDTEKCEGILKEWEEML